MSWDFFSRAPLFKGIKILFKLFFLYKFIVLTCSFVYIWYVFFYTENFLELSSVKYIYIYFIDWTEIYCFFFLCVHVKVFSFLIAFWVLWFIGYVLARKFPFFHGKLSWEFPFFSKHEFVREIYRCIKLVLVKKKLFISVMNQCASFAHII